MIKWNNFYFYCDAEEKFPPIARQETVSPSKANESIQDYSTPIYTISGQQEAYPENQQHYTHQTDPVPPSYNQLESSFSRYEYDNPVVLSVPEDGRSASYRYCQQNMERLNREDGDERSQSYQYAHQQLSLAQSHRGVETEL